MVGILVTQSRINEVLGGLINRLNNDFHEIELLTVWSNQTTQETIEALGFSADDAYLVKLIIQKLEELRKIYIGSTALTVAEDFRVNPQKAGGLGI